jgi:thiosulfate/3-mercaptopyruvate sulfurtransferase
MPDLALPYILEPEALRKVLYEPGMLIVCLGKREQYDQAHIPTARFLDHAKLNRGVPPATGQLPDIPSIERAFQTLGLRSDSHVVCYDDDAGTRAGRMMWILEAMGHSRQSFLNGGLLAWLSESLPVETVVHPVDLSHWQATLNPSVIADKHYVLGAINRAGTTILDARSPEEHLGQKSASTRLGRIPGSVNLNWLDTIDNNNNRRLKSKRELDKLLTQRHISKDDEIIVHCQTHQRSSHSFMMLRAMGFKNIKGYPGSWSEWADDKEMPIELG